MSYTIVSKRKVRAKTLKIVMWVGLGIGKGYNFEILTEGDFPDFGNSYFKVRTVSLKSTKLYNILIG